MYCDEARAAGHRIAGVARSTEAASIGLIDAIDGTVDTMTGLSSVMSGFDKMLLVLIAQISTKQPKPEKYLDPEDEAIDALSQASSSLKDVLTRLVRKRSAIDRDARLKGHHSEALHDAYEEASGAVADLIETVESLRGAIISHDLAAEPRDSAAYETVAALVESLRAK